MSLVVVSNRVARAKADEPLAGGLASALLPVVKSSGAMWVGSSGRVHEAGPKEPFAQIEALGTGALAVVDLPAAHYAGYYEGFANSALWPALHSRADLIRVTIEDYRSYREVNAFMARALQRICRRDATYWIQDYHFLPLAAELRRLGIDQPIGLFLHTPWPNRSVMTAVPHHRELAQAMLAYDLIGFQTDADRQNFADYVTNELELVVDEDNITSAYGTTIIGAFPIGIDADMFAARAAKAVARADVVRLKASLQSARLAIGVDRIDYSKGLDNRFRAFDRMLAAHPALKREVTLLQIAVPSRCQIKAYGQLQHDLSTLVGEINGRHGEVDWTPIRYLNKAFGQATLAGFYRTARMALVTPLHDGMNLVAKEYVAAQDPADPGVLVLSEFAGAAFELDAALLVNPHDVDSMATAMARAMTMSGEERRERWNVMMARLRANSVQIWFSKFLDKLTRTRALVAHLPAPPVERGRPAAVKIH
jgi:trehalose 6-phosphate synthase